MKVSIPYVMKQNSEPKTNNGLQSGLRVLLVGDEIPRLGKLCAMANTPDDYGKDSASIEKLAKWLKKLINDQKKDRPSPQIVNWLNAAMRPHYDEIPTRTWIERDGVHMQLMHPDEVPTDAMIAYMLGLALRSGKWKYIRLCKYEDCHKFFLDEKYRGGRVQMFCQPKHGTYHRRS